MGAEGAVSILYGKELEEVRRRCRAERARLEAEFREKFGKPYYAAASGHVDDVIAPSETRARLISCAGFSARQSRLVAGQETRQHATIASPLTPLLMDAVPSGEGNRSLLLKYAGSFQEKGLGDEAKGVTH